MLALLGLAATALFIALDVEFATAHSVQGDADSWSINPVDGDETWTGHAHTGWKQVNSARDAITWTGTPTGNPCAGDPNKVHCAYVIKHSNPWLIKKAGPPKHPQHNKTWFSDCAVLGGSEGSNAQRLNRSFSVGNMRFYRAGAATCTDGTDVRATGLFTGVPGAPSSFYSDAPDAHGGGHKHGDADFLLQHPEVNHYPANWPVVAQRGQHLPYQHSVIPDAHANGRCCDEIKAQGTHRDNGNTVTGADHKTVMFWVWWERAADAEPLCDDGTQPPCAEPNRTCPDTAPRNAGQVTPDGQHERDYCGIDETTMFVPVVTINVDVAADGTRFGGTEFGVSFAAVGGFACGVWLRRTTAGRRRRAARRCWRVRLLGVVASEVTWRYSVSASTLSPSYVTNEEDVGSLVDAPADGGRCPYGVVLPAEVAVGSFTLTLVRVSGSPLSGRIVGGVNDLQRPRDSAAASGTTAASQ